MKFQIGDKKRVDEVQKQVEGDSKLIDDIVDSIIHPYCKSLDEYIEWISEILQDGENPPTDQELDDMCINLATRIYFAGGLCEQLGIRDDISKAVYKEMYHTSRASIDKGTVADKDSLAELASQEEFVVSSAYTRAYKTMKAKVENAQELLQSIKKVIGRRMQETELTRIGGSGK